MSSSCKQNAVVVLVAQLSLLLLLTICCWLFHVVAVVVNVAVVVFIIHNANKHKCWSWIWIWIWRWRWSHLLRCLHMFSAGISREWSGVEWSWLTGRGQRGQAPAFIIYDLPWPYHSRRRTQRTKLLVRLPHLARNWFWKYRLTNFKKYMDVIRIMTRLLWYVSEMNSMPVAGTCRI